VKRVAKGRVAEQQAIDYLRDLGYTIVCRNYTISGGEIDVVVLDAETLVFVEVRFRQDDEAEGSLSTQKVEALAKASARYREETEFEGNYRFDFLAVSPKGIRHHKDFI
jgi:putative endonuclease